MLNEFGQLATKKSSVVPYNFKGLLFKKRLKISVCLIDDMGNWPTAAYVAWALGALKPKIAILAGIAGSLDAKALPVGSVVASYRAKTIYANKIKKRSEREVFVDEYLSSADGKIQVDRREKVFTDSFFRNKRRYYDPLPMEEEFSKIIEEIRTRCMSVGLPPEVSSVISGIKIGQIFSGDLVIDCEEAVQYISDKIKDDTLDYYRQKDMLDSADGNASYIRADWDFEPASAVDMESAGFLHAIQIAEATVTPFIVRGISDVCAQKNDNHQELAARNAIVSALAVAEMAYNHGAVIPGLND
ncbi:hypothetical protein [Hyphomonas adhaerens]|uniref:hypothetical protein n=1 Tax=Hyphomonas adhaerens TaxID=81029 RepID=UPI0012EC4C2D|nr:hypothetical protein [Hyphomonas adhaerens]